MQGTSWTGVFTYPYSVLLELGIIDLNQFGRRIDSAKRFECPSSSIYLAVSNAIASSACLLPTKVALIVLYYKVKQFTNVLVHIFT